MVVSVEAEKLLSIEDKFRQEVSSTVVINIIEDMEKKKESKEPEMKQIVQAQLKTMQMKAVSQ